MKKMLIIENDPDTRNILGYIFNEYEFEVLEYPDRIPIDKIIEDSPDLIVLDYFLDDVYGSEICEELKDNPVTRDIPVILLSTAINLKHLATKSRANAYLKKPFDLSSLETLVNELVY